MNFTNVKKILIKQFLTGIPDTNYLAFLNSIYKKLIKKNTTFEDNFKELKTTLGPYNDVNSIAYKD